MPERIRVLIADDHALVREGTRELLGKHADIEVVATAEDGLTARARIDELRPDVALVDVSMPGMSGIELTEEVSKSHTSVAILVLTVHDEEAYVRALLQAGAAGYLIKDVSEGDLVGAIRSVHAGESVLHPAVTKALFESIASGTAATVDSPLTDRETEVLRLAARGLSNREIGDSLGVSPRTAQTHLGNIFEKLQVASRTQAVILGLRQGWLGLEELM